MEIKILGGLTIEIFAEENSANQKQIQIQKKLYDSGVISGIQLRVGHDLTNKKDIQTLKQKVLNLGIPYIIHGAAENLGVDLGEYFDEKKIFSEYRKQNSQASWKDFNLNALKNSQIMAENSELLLDNRIIIHPGYASISQIKNGEQNAINTLKKLENINFSFETIPIYAGIDKDKKLLPIYGLGSTASEMKIFLDSRKGSNVLIDFTHVLVSANQKNQNQNYYSTLLSEFLRLPVSNLTHFSGLTNESEDEHKGFLKNNKAAKNNPTIEIIKNILTELGNRYLQKGKDVYVALEMGFKDIESTKRQIHAFRKDYCK